MIEYQGIYTDSSGEDPAVVHFDVTTIGFTTRGVEFTGGPDGYVTGLPEESPELASFSFVMDRSAADDGTVRQRRLLAGFKLCWSMPIGVVAHGREYPGELQVVYHFLDPGLARENLPHEPGSHPIANLIDLTIFYSYRKSRVTSGGSFEDVLNYLIATLGHDVHIKACIVCAYSDYPLSGHGCYGSMLCFRNLKEPYRLLQRGGEFDREGYIRLSHAPGVLAVGELHICPEFEPRAPGTGYRGWPAG